MYDIIYTYIHAYITIKMIMIVRNGTQTGLYHILFISETEMIMLQLLLTYGRKMASTFEWQ